MKIAFNPSTVAALTAPPNNKDITFDLRGRNIFARGVKFYGTDTNTWRDIKINNVSIGSHTLDLRNGSNITLSNTNGVVAINSTWRPVVDNLTSDSTTSSLSAKQGKVLKALIDGKSNSDHNHDGRYVRKSGDTMSGVLIIDTTNFGALAIKRSDDVNGASIQFRGKSSVYGYIGLNNSNKNKQFLRWNSDTSKVYTILDTSSTYTSSGKGVINGTTITQVDNATNATNSTNARKLVNWYSARPTSLNAQFGDGSLRIFYATSSTTVGKCPADATVLHLAWDHNGGWDSQLAVGPSSNRIYSRSQNNGTWQSWKTLAFTTDIPNKNSWNYDDRYYTKAESNAKYITDITTSVNKLTFTKNGSSIARTITVNNVQSLGKRSPLTERNAISGIYTYGTYSATDNLAPTNYFETLGFGEGVAGTIEIGGSWISGGKLYWRALRDYQENWFSWKTILDSSNYSSILDSRYYTESEVNSLLSKKLDRINLSVGTWNPRGYSLAADYHYNGGNLSISENGSKMYVSIDGQFYQNEGQYRVLDTSDIGSIRGGLTLYQHLSATDANWYPLVWGGSDHKNTNNSTGSLYKSYDKLSWQTSSQTLYATKLKTTNLDTQTAFFHPGNDSTLKIYSGKTQDAVSDGHIGLQTSIDNTDGQTHGYPTQYGSRCVLALQPRGGSVYIGNMPNGGNGRKLNVNGDIGLFNTGSIRDLSIGGGIYWNPYVESATDGSDAASITLVKSGVAGGTTLVLSQMNDANDTIQFKTSTAAKLYHNSYPILTTQNTYVNNHKGYIYGTEITQVNNSDTVDGWHKDNIQWTGYITSGNTLASYWFKMYDITVTGYQYNDITITFLVSEGFSSNFSIFHLKIRQNGTNNSGNYNLGVTLKELVGNLRDKVVVYYNNSTGNVQLWGNPNGQYNTMNYTILKKTTRTATDSSSLGILTAQSFSSVQTPPSTGYTKVTMARVGYVSYSDSTGSVHWNNVTNKPSTFNPAAHTHSWASITDKIVAGNEFNIVNAGFKESMWFNYLPINDRSKTATISGYHFGNGAKGYASIVASGFIKSGGNASQLLRADGGVAAFNWSGQAGQPTWLWGGNSQHSYYVYNPSNFKVASATKLQTARKIWGQSFDGTTDIDNTLRIRKTTGNYCEGIRIQTGDGNWATIILGATADSGTNTNAWSIHRKSDNNFAISRNSSDGTNGLVMTSTGMGLGTTTPTQRLDVAGNIRATGQLYLPTNGNYNAILMGDDCWMGDCNIGNVIGLSGRGNANAGGIKFGKGGMYIGYNGSNHYSSGTSLWSNFNADLLDGEHASAFTKIVGRHSISTTGTAPYKYIHLFRIANSNGYSTVDCEIDLRTRNHSAKLEIRIATPQYPYGAGSSISIIKKVINGRFCNLWVLQTIQSSGYNYYDIYYESGSWNSGVYDIILRGSNGNLVFEHKGTKLDTLPSKASIVTNQWVMWSDIAGKPSSFNPSSHRHDWSQIDNKPATATRWPSWAEVTGKPSSLKNPYAIKFKDINGNVATYDGSAVKDLTAGTYIAKLPYGFASFTSGATWGNTTGTSFASWNDSTGGSIDFRRDNPSKGKMSIKVDGRVYVNEGANPVLSAEYGNSFWGMRTPDGGNDWIRTPNNGLIPYVSGGAGGGHSSLGTSTWYFSTAYIDKVYGSLKGNADSATSTTKVIVNQHTTNDANYPLVWSNQSNTNNTTENQLFKSWADLYYNPKNKRLCVAGSAIIGASAVPSYTLDVRGSVIASSWLRTRGASGWYSESYRGGIYMSDTTWIRTFGDKPFYCNKQIYSSDSIRMGDIYLQRENEINNGANGNLHLNYRNTGNITLCNGGGKVGIGKSDPLYKLDVAGNGRFQDFVYCNAVYSNTLNHTSPTGHLIIGNKTKEISIRSSYLPDVPAVYLYQKFSTNVYYTANKGFGIRPYYLSSMDYRPIETISGNMYSVVTVGDSVQAISCIIADKANIMPQIRGTLIRFLPGDDGQIVLLKDLNNYGSTNGYFYVQPKGCNIIRSDNSNISIADGNISDACDDGKSRFFIYAKTHKVWIEFYCG